jgi:RNA polymerase sigma-70 factor (ECF subfamily)
MEQDTIPSSLQRLDPQALAAVHDRYYPVVYRYVSYRLEDSAVVEDITSDVFLALIQTIKDRPSSIKDLKAWLLGTASHHVQDHLRRKYRRPVENIDDQEWLSDDERTEDHVDSSLRMGAVKATLRRLTEEQQQVLALRFSQELSVEETAHMMGKTVNAVKVLQFRALAAIRRFLEER